MHACDCGHEPADHQMNFGACGAEDDTLWGPAPCTCPKYVWEGDQ